MNRRTKNDDRAESGREGRPWPVAAVRALALALALALCATFTAPAAGAAKKDKAAKPGKKDPAALTQTQGTTGADDPGAAPAELPSADSKTKSDGATAAGAPSEMWADPTFQRQFMGSYGVQSEIEPGLDSPEERELLEEVYGLISTDPQAATERLQQAITPDSSAMLDFVLGNVYFQQEDMANAAKNYESAIIKFPGFRRAHKNLGLVRFRQGKFAEAIPPLTRVIELGGGDGLTYGLLGYAYAASGQYVSAESAYRNAMLLQSDSLDWKLGLTQAVMKQQKYGEAATLCDELIAHSPDRADYWMLQANAYIGLNQPLEAAENYEIVDRMGGSTAASLFTLGDIYVNAELWDLAARAYGRAAAKLAPGQASQPLARVEVLAQRGALAQAKGLLSQVEQEQGESLSDDERKKLLKIEARLAVAEGEGGEAVQVLEQIVALDPLDGEALILLGQHYASANDPERALFYYERAGSLEKYEADAKVRQAQLLVGQSRYDAALPLLKRAQELQPRDDVARYLEQVERAARSRR